MSKRLGTHDDTPLPQAVPHHIADPTGRIEHFDLFADDDDVVDDGARLSDELTLPEVVRPGGEPIEDDEDLSESLVTRQIPRIDPEQLEKLLALEGVPAIPGLDDDEDQTRPLPALDDKKR